MRLVARWTALIQVVDSKVTVVSLWEMFHSRKKKNHFNLQSHGH